MTVTEKPTVIAIAAISGGGKTTITNQLNEKLIKSKAFYFDDYDFEDSPEDLCEWVDQGANYNSWNLTPLIQDLQALISDSNQLINYIWLDYPFAYLNSKMQKYIDLTIYIDTPLDIAMARRLIRDFSTNPNDIPNDLMNYLSKGRKAYLEMIKSVRTNSDIIIDGSLSITEIVYRIIEGLRNRSL